MGLTTPLRRLDDRVLGDKLRRKPPSEQVDPPADPANQVDPPAKQVDPPSERRGRQRAGTAEAMRGSRNGVRKTLGIIYLVSRVVLLLLALVLVIAIAFILLPTNQDNTIVSTVLDLAVVIAGPVADVFTVADDAERELVVNYAFAAVLYVIAGLLVTLLPGSDT